MTLDFGEARIEFRDDGVYAVVGYETHPSGNGIPQNIEVEGELSTEEVKRVARVVLRAALKQTLGGD